MSGFRQAWHVEVERRADEPPPQRPGAATPPPRRLPAVPYHVAACPGGGTGLRDGLKIHWPARPCGFESRPGHHDPTTAEAGRDAQPERGRGGMCRVGRETERRRAVARLAVLALAIAVAFALVTLAGIGPSEAQSWVAGAACRPGRVRAGRRGARPRSLPRARDRDRCRDAVRRARRDALALAAALVGGRPLPDRRAAVRRRRDALGRPARPALARVAGRANGFSAVLATRLAPGMPFGRGQLPRRPGRDPPARVLPGRRARRAAEDDRVRLARRRAGRPALRARRVRGRALRRSRRRRRARRPPPGATGPAAAESRNLRQSTIDRPQT